MQRVRIKSLDGLWQEKDISGIDLADWFKDHTKDGVVCDEIILFTDAVFKSEGDGVSWVMSDMSLDRDAERVDPNGADLKSFKKNPVLLWAHDTTRPAIGKVMNPRVKDNQLIGKIVFDSKENDPFAGMIDGKVKAGIIQSGSIGFKPNTVEFIEESKDPTRLIHRKWELLEFSICNVPANANAMVQNAAKPEDEKESLDPNPEEQREDKPEIVAKGYFADLLSQTDTSVDILFDARDKTSPENETSSNAEEGSLDVLIGVNNGN
jgi:HK97 family phage prohead protease